MGGAVLVSDPRADVARPSRWSALLVLRSRSFGRDRVRRRDDACPLLATAEDAGHASFKLHDVVVGELDIGIIGLAVFGIVDMANPTLLFGTPIAHCFFFHIEQNGHSQNRTAT